MRTILLISILPLVASAFAADGDRSVVTGGKNVVNAVWDDAGRAPEVSDASSGWNFGFRPYGSGSAQLVSDPRVIRNALDGVGDGKTVPTGLSVTMNDDGLQLHVLCFTPPADEILAATNAVSQRLEFFVADGSADTQGIVPYNMMVYNGGNSAEDYPAIEYDRHYRDLGPYVHCSSEVRERYTIVHIRYDWLGFYDRLDFLWNGAPETLWRVSMIRWSDPTGGKTFGGPVHSMGRCGYIRIPALTAAQRLRIAKGTLVKAWNNYRRTMERSFDLAADEKFVKIRGKQIFLRPQLERRPVELGDLAKNPRTYLNFGEDPAMRPELKRRIAACDALGAEIAAFAGLDAAGQSAFYRRATDRLMNFRLDVEERYADILSDRLVELCEKEVGK